MKTLLTPRDVADILSVDASTVYRWARDGVLPAVRIGSIVRFDPDVLKLRISGQSVGETAPSIPPVRNDVPRVKRLRAAAMARIPVPPS